MGNEGYYELTLTTVDSRSVSDIDIWVRFFEAPRPTTDLVSKHNLRFDPSQSFTLDAYPQASSLVCEVNAPYFRINRSGTFTLTDGALKKVDIKLFRSPDDWRPQFDKWNSLGQEFRRLTDVLAASPNIRLMGGEHFDFFTGDEYDNLTTKDGILAKTCLLNLFFKFSRMIEPVGREWPWFKFVQRILEFNRERFIAIVDDEMGQIVREINDNIKQYSSYKRTLAQNHYGNIPEGYHVERPEMFSIKSDEDNGNIQLTMSPAIAPDGSRVTLLDADIDEDGKLLDHLADILKHIFTGGTHPIDIHEYLQLSFPNQRIGYSLVKV